MVNAIRDDARQLYEAGAFTTGEVGGNTAATSMTNKSRRLCDVCGLFNDALSVNAGNVKQREDLFDLMGDLRELLMDEFGRPLSESMELQYLRYPGNGGFYGRHLDHYAEDNNNDVIWSVSLLIYLNDSTWDAEIDGGSLQAYPRGQAPQSVAPTGGTLVLFDSAAVEHEVLAANKVRWALVGWFMMEGTKEKKKKKKNKGGRQGKQSKDSSLKEGKEGNKKKARKSKHKQKL
jgi:hypothetical protein